MKTIMGTKICKHICAALSLVMLCGMPFTGTAYSAETGLKTQQTDETKPTSPDVSSNTSKFVETNDVTTLKTSGKIDDRLCEILEKAADDELIPVLIWIADIDFEEVEKRVEKEVGLSKSIIEQKSDAFFNDFIEMNKAGLCSTSALTPQSDNELLSAIGDYKKMNKAQMEQFAIDIETYTFEQRKIAKDMHIELNNAFVDAFLTGAEDVTVYGAFPIIECSITKERILYLAGLSCVDTISSNSSENVVYPDCMINCVELATDETDTLSVSSVTAN